ncbi:MAG TPA: AAA family ATPase, partial [Solirubrobacteraceae bacterium]|nr:AAA family ATPase [Solirubrobacteraceae bacterium]
MSGSGASGELISERLLERGAELARLEQLARSARAGTGGLAVIAGPAGIGKTRLLEHACVATRGDVELLRARGGELERTFPYGVVRQLFEPA